MENEFKDRKRTRLKEFDYNTCGAYFITVCTQERRCILGSIGGSDNVQTVGEGSPLPNLTGYGKITEDIIKEIAKKYPSVLVDSYVIMPNHIHLVLILLDAENNMGNPYGRGDPNGRGNPSPTVSDVVGWFKYRATKRINELRNSPGEKVFQRSFYDHIIRNEKDYNEITKYISDNPINWFYDKLYSEE